MYSICIFGSQARRTADSMSDRDVLLVGPSSPALENAVARWETNKWNVSVFERHAITRLADVKALFIQHLKQEGLLLLDDGNFLNYLMNSYSPKNDYSAERNDALAQICSLPATTGNYWHDLCLSDIVYVLFRNASILHLACAGEYVFQYDALIARMSDVFRLSNCERDALLSLRRLKHGYRRRTEGLAVRSPLFEARHVIERIVLGLPDRIASSIAAGKTTDEYIRLRLAELKLLAHYSPVVLDMIGPEHYIFPLWQSIRCGGGYQKPQIKLH